jgi:uncharacterized protein YaiI (UPF0178 family)
VIGHNGKPFTTASIGGAIATRAIMADPRVAADGVTGGPKPFAAESLDGVAANIACRL